MSIFGVAYIVGVSVGISLTFDWEPLGVEILVVLTRSYMVDILSEKAGGSLRLVEDSNFSLLFSNLNLSFIKAQVSSTCLDSP